MNFNIYRQLKLLKVWFKWKSKANSNSSEHNGNARCQNGIIGKHNARWLHASQLKANVVYPF